MRLTIAFYPAVFLHNQNVGTKIKVSQERIELSKWNKKHFSLFLKGFHWIESPNLMYYISSKKHLVKQNTLLVFMERKEFSQKVF